MLRRTSLAMFATLIIIALAAVPASTFSPGVGNVPQGTQSDRAYAKSGADRVTNVPATTQRISCYTPEVAFFTSLAPVNGYDGMTECTGADTGEDPGPYPTQAGSNPGYPAARAMLVKDHSESDIRLDPTNPSHLIGQSKWFVSGEGYNHVLGFYESWDGGVSWPVQGHVPGYEGWTDNTDPVGAFDRFGNFYALILPSQFFYDGDVKSYQINQNREPNPAQAAEAIPVAVRPHGAKTARDWITTHNGSPDTVTTYDSVGREPDKQWIAIDTNPTSPFRDRIYAMWVVFTGPYTAHPLVSIAQALPNGTHTDWSAPISLPEVGGTPTGGTYLLPHITADGTLYTSLVTTMPKKKFCFDVLFLDKAKPNRDVAANGTSGVGFSDGGLACPAAGTAEAAAAGIALDTANANYGGPLPPYGAMNYCVNASIQFYTATLAPKGNNIRLTQHTWDPQLHAPHTSCPTCLNTFIGDYFGITSAGGKSYTTSVTTYNDGTNPSHYQQQVIAILVIP